MHDNRQGMAGERHKWSHDSDTNITAATRKEGRKEGSWDGEVEMTMVTTRRNDDNGRGE